MKYKHIIWDWNGTLIDDAWLCVEIMNKILEKRSLDLITLDDYRKHFTFPVRDYYVKLGFDFSLEPFEESGLEFIDGFKERMYDADLYVDTINTLSKISKSGSTQSILSAQHQSILRKTITHYGIDDYFIQIKGLNNHYADSKIEIGQKGLLELDYNANQVVLIGDTEHDFEVAQAMGIDCILLSHGHNSFDRLAKLDNIIFDSLENFCNYILE